MRFLTLATVLIVLGMFGQVLISAPGEKTTNVNWTVRDIGSNTNSTGTVYTVQLQVMQVPGGRQNGIVTLASSTPFTGLTVGQTVSSTFALATAAAY